MTQKEYMTFVLGYDIIHDKLDKADVPCDIAIAICEKIYKQFKGSKEDVKTKSEYECLQDWIGNHKDEVDAMIKLENIE